MGHSLFWNEYEFEPWGRSEADPVGRQTPGVGCRGHRSIRLSLRHIRRQEERRHAFCATNSAFDRLPETVKRNDDLVRGAS